VQVARRILGKAKVAFMSIKALKDFPIRNIIIVRNAYIKCG